MEYDPRDIVTRLPAFLWTRVRFSSVQFSRSVMFDFATPWTAACQASLSITNSQSLPKLMSIKLVMPSSHLILCYPLLLLPLIFPSIRVFFNESALHVRWPKYWSFSFNISPCQELAREIPSMTRSCGGGLTSKADQESRDPLDLLEHVPQNQNLSYYFVPFTNSSDINRQLSLTTFLWKKST